MSGIVGWLDPFGVEPSRLIDAAAPAAYRGSIELLTVTDSIVLGTLARPDEARSASLTDRSVLVMDGRVDATIAPPGAPAPIDRAPHEVMHDAMERRGPDALNAFAAEFALALASPIEGRLTLARDAFGLHPLYVASMGRRFAFASDPAVLVRLGLASGELDGDVIAAALARSEPLDGRTAFRGVVELLPGSWLQVDVEGRREQGQWFEPERLRGPRLRGNEAVDAVKEAVTRAVISRTGGGSTGVLLSGGRDSGSVAIAAARAGIELTGLTQTFDDDLPVQEAALARDLARREGIRWLPAPVASRPSWAELQDVPRWSGTPLAHWAFPQAVGPIDAAADAGISVLLTGDGGDPLFSASDVAVLDLARTGRFVSAARATHAFHRVWHYPYSRIAKVAGRAVAPRSLLRVRERLRPVPPWVRHRVSYSFVEETAPRSDRHSLLMQLRAPHPAGFDLDERLAQTRGVRLAHPLLDLRVVGVALSLGLRDRVPAPRPKPMLAAAFLGDLAATRVKMSFLAYYDRLARRMHAAYPELFAPGNLSSRTGFVDGAALKHAGTDRWRTESLGAAVLELWLREQL